MYRLAIMHSFTDRQHYDPLALILCGQDTLESRRTQLTERFFWRSVLCEASCLHYLLPEERDSSVTDRLHHAKTSEHIPVNFRILLSPIACDITISLGLVWYCIDFIVLYWLLFQSSHWLLYQINHLSFVSQSHCVQYNRVK